MREATNAQNHQNYSKPRSNNRSGIRGIYLKKNGGGKWCAAIQIDGVKIHLGTFETQEEAVAARQGAQSTLHPFTNRS